MKKILGLTIAVLLIIGIVGAGTWAYFSDTASSTGNTWTAGTLTLGLVTTGAATNATASASPAGINNSMQFTNVKPGSSGTITWTLNNTGTVPGTLTLASTATFGQGGAANAPEATAETALGGVKGLDTGIMVWVTAGGTDILGATGAYVAMSGLEAALDLQVNHAITIGTPLVYVLNWQVPTSVGNEIQGDTAQLDITFTLNQIP